MKKIFLLSMVFFAFIFNVNAQKNMNTSYSFNVANQDEQKVLKLYKDYFGKKENLVKGITVSLYQNHFKGNDDATHEVVFSGTTDVLGAAYDSPSSTAWELFQSELSKYCKGVRAAEGKRGSNFGDTSSAIYPVQDAYFINVKDPEQYKAKFEAFWSKNIPANTRISFGSVTTLNEEKTTHYVVRSYKDFTTKFKDDAAYNKTTTEFTNSVKDIRTFNYSTTRILLGRW